MNKGIIAVIVLAVLAGGGYMLMHKDMDKKDRHHDDDMHMHEDGTMHKDGDEHAADEMMKGDAAMEADDAAAPTPAVRDDAAGVDAALSELDALDGEDYDDSALDGEFDGSDIDSLNNAYGI